MTNKLKESNSPYLLQHADNPVDWFPWGPEALKKALEEDKPIFLSIGYAACHWCHVMAHESFEDPETAEVMNEFFVNIKVDREERPDIDSIYMDAVVALTGQGGWPLSAFLSPDQKPFYGGTYFPPVPRYNMPSFRDLLETIARLWKEDRERLTQTGDQISEYLTKNITVLSGIGQLQEESLVQGSSKIAASYDWQNGGWGHAPKFPQPMTIMFLLRQAVKGDQKSLDIAVHALKAMAKGGMHDLIGGGFARYSTDDIWLVPHFEKMLYDNAQLARAYLHAYLMTGDQEFRLVCERTLNFVMREMTHPLGGFFSSLDADSEGEEGKYYVWSEEEILRVFEQKEDSDLYTTAYGVTQAGNFEGKFILRRAKSDRDLSEMFGVSEDEVKQRIDHLNMKLFDERLKRIPPQTDDKVVAGWNGLMLVAFSESARYLGLAGYRDMATRNANFLLSSMRSNGRLFRSWRDEQAEIYGYLEDYAAVILGLLAVYQTAPDPKWFQAASELTDYMVDQFSGADGLFYDTPADHENLLIRPRDLQDNATPSGNALAATALFQMAAYQGDSKLKDIAEKSLGKVFPSAVKYPTAFAMWLCAVDFSLSPTQEVAILGDHDHSHTKAFVEALWSKYRPNTIAAISPYPPLDGPNLLENRSLLNNLPTAYICEGFICKQPLNDVEMFNSQLKV
jgi:uncharacterized protein YyaL (SSP411 family)